MQIDALSWAAMDWLEPGMLPDPRTTTRCLLIRSASRLAVAEVMAAAMSSPV
ncbi:hypothetical protein [Streptomyces sp. SudanB5_2050]|uniref:hypothetical protein n=1 Tax=Streptomyces sp. SudanB5_2050 TaxID=3035274 RepID=UPI0036DBA001